MDTGSRPTPIIEPDSPGFSAPPPAYGSMDQVSSGPAALLYTLSNELISIYNEMQASYCDMTTKEAEVQENTINTAAEAQRQQAEYQAWGIACQAFGAAISAGSSIFSVVAESRTNKQDTDLAGTQKADLDKMDKLQAVTRGVAPAQRVTGPATDDEDPYIDARKKQLLDDPTVPSKATDAENGAAYAAMDEKEQLRFKQDLQEKITAKEKALNTTQSRINHRQTQIQTWGQLITGTGNALGQGGQAVYTGLAGQQQAAQQLTSSVTQMANSTAETTKQNLGKYYDTAIQASNAAKEAARASYAQT